MENKTNETNNENEKSKSEIIIELFEQLDKETRSKLIISLFQKYITSAKKDLIDSFISNLEKIRDNEDESYFNIDFFKKKFNL